jgi:hypothetical protein
VASQWRARRIIKASLRHLPTCVIWSAGVTHAVGHGVHDLSVGRGGSVSCQLSGAAAAVLLTAARALHPRPVVRAELRTARAAELALHLVVAHDAHPAQRLHKVCARSHQRHHASAPPRPASNAGV